MNDGRSRWAADVLGENRQRRRLGLLARRFVLLALLTAVAMRVWS
jgi:hypothetical protein